MVVQVELWSLQGVKGDGGGRGRAPLCELEGVRGRGWRVGGWGGDSTHLGYIQKMQQVSRLQLKQPSTTAGKQRNICCVTRWVEQHRLTFTRPQRGPPPEQQQQQQQLTGRCGRSERSLTGSAPAENFHYTFIL